MRGADHTRRLLALLVAVFCLAQQGVAAEDQTAIRQLPGAPASAQPTPSSAASSARAAPPSLELLVLGSGGPGATGRAGPGYVVLVDGVPRVFVDAGPGSFARLGEAHLDLSHADIVLLTHLHVDHAGELPGLLKARAVSGRGALDIAIYGPPGRRAARPGEANFPSTRRFVDLLFGAQGAFAYLKDFSAPLQLHATDVPLQAAPRPIHREERFTISAVAGHHRDAPAVVYRIDHVSGASIAFSGDIDAQGLPALQRIADRAGLLVFNTVVLDRPDSPEVLYSLHSPPDAIGALAAAAGARRLLLSHLSPAVLGRRDAVTASIAAHFGGPVTFAEDGQRVTP